MKLESFIPAKALNRTRFQDGDIEYQIEGEELTTHFPVTILNSRSSIS